MQNKCRILQNNYAQGNLRGKSKEMRVRLIENQKKNILINKRTKFKRKASATRKNDEIRDCLTNWVISDINYHLGS